MGLAVRPELPLHDEAGVRLQDRAPPTSIAAGPASSPIDFVDRVLDTTVVWLPDKNAAAYTVVLSAEAAKARGCPRRA